MQSNSGCGRYDLFPPYLPLTLSGSKIVDLGTQWPCRHNDIVLHVMGICLYSWQFCKDNVMYIHPPQCVCVVCVCVCMCACIIFLGECPKGST